MEILPVALSPTQRQSFTLPNEYTWSPVAFDQFDPALGTYTGVRVDLTVTAAGSLSVENLEQGPATVTVEYPAVMWVDGLWTSFGSVAATAAGTVALPAFDGTVDFAGASGTVLAGVSDSRTVTQTFAAGGYEASIFLGTGTMQFYAYATVGLEASAGAAFRLLSEVAPVVGEIAVTYEYAPAAGGTTGVVIRNDTVSSIPVVQAATTQTMTTVRQVRNVAAQAVGWTQNVTLEGFDPTLGTLVGVNLRLATAGVGKVGLENQGARSGPVSAIQAVVADASLPGGASPIATALAESGAHRFYLDGDDGIDDFAGSGGVRFDWVNGGRSIAQLTEPAVLSAFGAGGIVELSLHATGSGGIERLTEGLTDILVEMTADASASLDVSYTYVPNGPVTPIAIANGSQGTEELPTPVGYVGPVAGVVNEFARITPDNLAVSAATDSWYIRTGSGTDAIQVSGGINVLDGGGGSNYLVGGAGEDTFFVDATWTTAPLWNTIDGFSSGDAATIWGLTSWGHLLSWRDGQGALGAEGLTLHARAPGLPPVSTTFVGFSMADLANGVLDVSFGTASDLPYMHIRAV
jgi:hypothetical protein